ncbi:pyrroline-5-carboxylate reductase [bacterium]|nr:pyrroline-5-carboxylate reductase [bacterium]
MDKKLAILGAGNIGLSIANGLTVSGTFRPDQITLTRRKMHLLAPQGKTGFHVDLNNREATARSEIICIAVEPGQMDSLLTEIRPVLKTKKHMLISVISGVSLNSIKKQLGKQIPVIRAMPNTAIAIRQSMTCLASDDNDSDAMNMARQIFDAVGQTLVIDEEQMTAATSLGACGIAFFLRAIRAASQGGIEIGFQSGAALTIAAQTALGAASLLLNNENHPEREIDKVTTPRGCTISGLNQMEHEGFSSAMIKGIITSAEKAAGLYKKCH